MSVTKRIASGDYNLTTTASVSNVVVTTTTLKIFGNLIVQGNSSFINVANISTADPTITLNANVASIFQGNSGLEINRPASYTPALYWNETVKAWQIVGNIADTTSYANIATTTLGSGTVNAGTATHMPYYAANGTTVSDGGNNLTWNGANTLTITGNVSTTNLVLNGTYLTIGTVNSGGTGIYFNNAGTVDELASKSAAIKYSIIFG